jgi:hypothetical protein
MALEIRKRRGSMSDDEKPKLPSAMQHISDFLQELENCISKVTTGEMPEGQAKVILGYRKTQLQALSLNLRYQQLTKWRTGSEDMPVLAKKNQSGEPDKIV